MRRDKPLRIARAWVKLQQNWWAYTEVQDAVEMRPRAACVVATSRIAEKSGGFGATFARPCSKP
jgi:hypothetical protein